MKSLLWFVLPSSQIPTNESFEPPRILTLPMLSEITGIKFTELWDRRLLIRHFGDPDFIYLKNYNNNWENVLGSFSLKTKTYNSS